MSVSGQAAPYLVQAGSAVYTSVVATPSATNTWTELVASASSTLLVVGFRWDNTAGGYDNVTLELGLGAAGSEATIFSFTGFGYDYYPEVTLPFPLPLRVAAGSRLAVKLTTVVGISYAALGVYYVSEGNLI